MSHFTPSRFQHGARKLTGAHFTPRALASFLAEQIRRQLPLGSSHRPLRLLDPAVGDGELLNALVVELRQHGHGNVEIFGYDTNLQALELAKTRLKESASNARVNLCQDDFLPIALESSEGKTADLYRPSLIPSIDVVIANPPYVRTQLIGSHYAQQLAAQFELSGRVDLYHAFIRAIGRVLRRGGVAGIIVSNRFMTTKSGSSVRASLKEEFDIVHVWDLGDTRLFEAAVLPAVLLLRAKTNSRQPDPATFTTIYSTDRDGSSATCSDIISALDRHGLVELPGGQRYWVQHGRLDAGTGPKDVWRIATDHFDQWLDTVRAHTHCTFGDLGKIRVGVKTTADSVFIRSDWQDMPPSNQPELLLPLTTHHIAHRFKPGRAVKPIQIVYPHRVVDGKRSAVDLAGFPRTATYLERYRNILEARRYVVDAGRQWYEIWVPQDPDAWSAPKIVFRDIAARPEAWLDMDGTVVNGDCYWLRCNNSNDAELLWLALAVANSTFIEAFYDRCFNNKLYAGRRRFITQYVQKFPLPAPDSETGRKIISTAKQIYDLLPSADTRELEKQLDDLVWNAFGLTIEEVGR